MNKKHKNFYDKKKRMMHVGNSYIHKQATVTGMVTLGNNCSIWPGAVLRADTNTITLGKSVNIQDNTTLHVDSRNLLDIGDYSLVGHNAMIHGALVGKACLIGISAIVLDGAIIGDGAIITAGCIIRGGKKIPPRALVIQKGNELKVYAEKANPVTVVAASLEYVYLAKRMNQCKFGLISEKKEQQFQVEAEKIVAAIFDKDGKLNAL